WGIFVVRRQRVAPPAKIFIPIELYSPPIELEIHGLFTSAATAASRRLPIVQSMQTFGENIVRQRIHQRSWFVLPLISLALLTVPDAASPQTTTHKHYAASEEASKPSPTGALAPRLQNVGSHVFPVTTQSEQARLFMNQGLNLTYGFN